MASLNDIVTVTITRTTVFPTQPGFVPAFFTYHTLWNDLVKRITDPSDLTALSVPTTAPMYIWSQAVFGQSPRPEAVIICKRTRVFTQVQVLTPLSAVAGDIYTFDVRTSTQSAWTTITRTVPGASSLTAEGTAIAALISAAIGADGTSASVAGVITNTAVAGKIIEFRNLPKLALMTVSDTTTDPGIASDFADCNAASALGGSSVSYFGVTLDQAGKATILALAAAVESTQQFLIARTSDSACATSASNDVMSTAKASAYSRTAIVFAQYATHDYRDGALFGKILPYTPGTITAAHKTLAGIHADTLSSGERGYILGKNGSTYETISGTNELFEGMCASGDFMDTIFGQTELAAAMQLAVFINFLSQLKVPYTDFGIQGVGSIMQSVLDARTAKGLGDPAFLAASPAPNVLLPKASAVSSSDKSARILKNAKWNATIAGAIHRANITGNLSL